MKKIISIALIVLLLLCMMPAGAFATTKTGFPPEWKESAQGVGMSGKGTISNPYCINNSYQFSLLIDKMNEGWDFTQGYFRLTDNVYSISNINPKNKPCFSGCFDGNGYSIEIKGTTTQFFRITSKGVIKNLTVKGSISGMENCGGICSTNEGLIINCVNELNIKNARITGGICYSNLGRIVNCVNKGAIGTLDNIGISDGICYSNNGTIANCVNYGEIIQRVSGINGGICENNAGTVENCYFTNAPDNGYGTMLSEEQIIAEHGTDGALIDLLSGYKAEDIGKNKLLPWVMDDNRYPQLDFSKIQLTGSIISTGYPWMIITIAVVAVGCAAFLIIKKKKSV